jgi:hypothetical protein
MLKFLSVTVVLVAAAVPRSTTVNASAQPPHWRLCVVHLDWAHMQHVTGRSCVHYPMPKHTGQHITGHVKTCHRQSPHVVVCTRVPLFPQPTPAAPRVTALRTVPMLITYYLATGSPMADGQYPYIGAAACGYDLSLGTRVIVPGVGTLTCGDRIGYQPWDHIDVYGVPVAPGYRNVTVLQ